MQKKKVTITIVQTQCHFLRTAIEYLSASLIKRVTNAPDVIIFIDTRTIGRDSIPFFEKDEKVLCIYLCEERSNLSANCISLSAKLNDFIRQFYSLVLRFNTSQVRQAMFWVKSSTFLTLSKKELITVYLLCKGFKVKDISAAEQVAEKTIYSRISSVKRKMNCKSTPVLISNMSSHCEVIMKMIGGIHVRNDL